MKLSEVLKKYLPDIDFKIYKEQEFATLGLTGAAVDDNFCTFLDRLEYIDSVAPNAKMILTNSETAEKIKREDIGICVVDNPRVVFFMLHNAISEEPFYAREKKQNKIGVNCKISSSAAIAPNNVVIGNNVIIEENVIIRENVSIGDNCIIRAGVIIGNPDFEFKRFKDEIFGVKHCGGVIIGNCVEILSNTGVNRAVYPWDNTEIGDYVKIDMLCNISHGAKIGDRTMIVALSGVGGRVEIGSDSWIGYGCILRNGIKIGNHARVNMGSVVTRNVEDGKAVSGNFAIDHDLFLAELKNRTRTETRG